MRVLFVAHVVVWALLAGYLAWLHAVARSPRR